MSVLSNPLNKTHHYHSQHKVSSDDNKRNGHSQNFSLESIRYVGIAYRLFLYNSITSFAFKCIRAWKCWIKLLLVTEAFQNTTINCIINFIITRIIKVSIPLSKWSFQQELAFSFKDFCTILCWILKQRLVCFLRANENDNKRSTK